MRIVAALYQIIVLSSDRRKTAFFNPLGISDHLSFGKL
jgi:hypothetical protein